jgi:hypothetical protein
MRAHKVYRFAPDVEGEALQAIDEVERGEGIVLTAEEMDQWQKTGHLPERAMGRLPKK